MIISNAEALNQYIKELFAYWDGENDNFEPVPIPKEIDDEMQKRFILICVDIYVRDILSYLLISL